MIVLETNCLHGRANPDAAGRIKTLLGLASQVGMVVAIPEPCRIELREGMREKLIEAQKLLNDAKNAVQRLRVPIEYPTLDVDGALATYMERLETYFQSHHVRTIPFPDRDRMPDVRELFEAAARKQPPFGIDGNSYRDAMIALSVEVYARTSNTSGILFVTDDRRFREVFRSDVVKPVTVEEATEDLERRLTVEQQAKRERIRTQIEAALFARLSEIARRASSDVEFRLPSVPGQTIESIDAFVATKVLGVEPSAIDQPAVDFAAKVMGTIVATVDESPSVAAETSEQVKAMLAAMLRDRNRPNKVGQKTSTQAQDRLVEALWVNRPPISDYTKYRRALKFDVELTVDGSAHLDGETVAGITLGSLRQSRASP